MIQIDINIDVDIDRYVRGDLLGDWREPMMEAKSCKRPSASWRPWEAGRMLFSPSPKASETGKLLIKLSLQGQWPQNPGSCKCKSWSTKTRSLKLISKDRGRVYPSPTR